MTIETTIKPTTKKSVESVQAIIETGGKQYLVAKDEVLEVELLNSTDEKKLELAPLLVINGDKILVGRPTVEGAKVTAEILEQTKGPKLEVLRFKAKKRVKSKIGHRQKYVQIKITAITA